MIEIKKIKNDMIELKNFGPNIKYPLVHCQANLES
jgi:hypothetical protein